MGNDYTETVTLEAFVMFDCVSVYIVYAGNKTLCDICSEKARSSRKKKHQRAESDATPEEEVANNTTAKENGICKRWNPVVGPHILVLSTILSPKRPTRYEVELPETSLI